MQEQHGDPGSSNIEGPWQFKGLHIAEAAGVTCHVADALISVMFLHAGPDILQPLQWLGLK